MTGTSKHNKHSAAFARAKSIENRETGLSREICNGIEDWIKNRMEPDRAFTSEVGQNTAILPMNFNIKRDITLGTDRYGFIAARPALDNTYWQSGVEDVHDLDFGENVPISNDNLVAGEKYYYQGTLYDVEGEEIEPSQTAESTPFYEGKFGVSDPASANTAISVTVRATGSTSGLLYLVETDETGTESDTVFKNVSTTGLATVNFSESELNSVSDTTGVAIYFIPSANSPAPEMSIKFENGVVLDAPFENSLDLESLVEDEVAEAILRKQLMWRISALSLLLKNTTPELTKGGDLVAAMLPPGVAAELPSEPEEVFKYLGKLDTYSKKDIQLKDGAHISLVPGCIYNKILKPRSDRGDDNQLPVMCIAWRAPGNTVTFGNQNQLSLSAVIKLNVEIVSTIQGLPKRECHPSFEGVYRSMETAMCLNYSDVISSNDGHTRKIGKLARKVARDQDVQDATKKVLKTGGKAALGLLLTLL